MNYTSNTYQMKRDLIEFSKRISKGTEKHWQKFCADMVYGITKSGSCILSQMADGLMEKTQKKNTVERLSRKLESPQPEAFIENYRKEASKLLDKEGAVFVDESEIIKPYGKAFEALGIVRDGSAQEQRFEKGYHITEIVALTARTKQPVSLFSRVHSSKAQGFESVNEITFQGLREVFDIAPDATYVFDRGYDMNRLFSFMYENNKQFIIRLTEKRNLFYKGKWYKAPVLRDTHKGKFRADMRFSGETVPCYLTCINIMITESRHPLKLVLVYGLGQTPMMLATNRKLVCKEDVIAVARTYLSRWRIEEYFRFKKQHFRFENLRVRSLASINALNHFVSYAITFLASIAERAITSVLRSAILKHANAQKDKVTFWMYRFALGAVRLLALARSGIREWFHVGRPRYRQLEMDLD